MNWKKLLANIGASAVAAAGAYVGTYGTPTDGNGWAHFATAVVVGITLNQSGLHQLPPDIRASVQ